MHFDSAARTSGEQVVQKNGCGRSPRILIAEQDAEMCALLAQVLQDRGYEVITASSEQQALCLLGQSGQLGTLDGYVVDIEMFGDRGRERLAGLAGIGGTAPLILVMPLASEGLDDAPVEIRAVARLRRPVHIQDLLTALERAARAARQGPAAGNSGGVPGPVPQTGDRTKPSGEGRKKP